MKRASALLMSALMSFGTAMALQGCGSEDSRPRKSVAVKRAKSLEEMSPQERAQTIAKREQIVRQMWMWADGDAPHDPNVDAAACKKAMNQEAGLVDANPLVQMSWQASCMKRKGWKMNPDADLAGNLR